MVAKRYAQDSGLRLKDCRHAAAFGKSLRNLLHVNAKFFAVHELLGPWERKISRRLPQGKQALGNLAGTGRDMFWPAGKT